MYRGMPPSLGMMTSSVQESIAAADFGYDKFLKEQAPASEDPGCPVIVYDQASFEASSSEGREYFKVN